MKITVTAFLLAKRDMDIQHPLGVKGLSCSETSWIDDVVEIVTQTQHKTISTVSLNV